MASPSEPGDDPQSRHRRRSTWNFGGVDQTEKNVYGRFFDDTVYAFAEFSVLSLPALWIVLMTGPARFFGTKAATFIAWLTMVLVIPVFRGRLISPPGTDSPGWVSLRPLLVGLRVVYYNVVLLAIGYGGGAIALTGGLPLTSIAVAFVAGVLAIVAFPWIAELLQQRFAAQ